MPLRIILFLLILLSPALISCSGSGKTPPPDPVFEALDFEIDSTRLGDVIEIGGLTLRAPLEWYPANESTMETMRRTVAQDTSRFRLAPRAVFIHPAGSILIASEFEKGTGTDYPFANWAIEVAEAYKSSRRESSISEAWLSISGIEALQLYAADSTTVHFKVLLRGEKPVSLDYTVPRRDWDSRVRSVESSLGTVRRLR